MGFWTALLGVRPRGETGQEPADSVPRGSRPWTCGILYRTSMPVREIESWLTSHANGRWQVSLEEMDASLKGKVLRIMFERRDDKAAFARDFSRR